MPRKSAPLALEYILLAVLDEKSCHGYDLFRELNELHAIQLIWNLKQSMLYALLEKLEHEGLIVGQIVVGESRPSRREYSLTNHGRQTLLDWMGSPVKHGREMRQDFLARLYFASKKNNQTALALVEKQKKECCLWLDGWQKQKKDLERVGGYDHFVITFRISQVQAMLDWLETCQDELLEQK